MFITIPGFESMTAQEVFDMSARHVLANGRPSMDGDNCVYYGIGCAAAVFIREDSRTLPMKTATWNRVVSDGLAPDHNKQLIRELQYAHDSSHDSTKFVESFTDYLRWIARDYGLSAAVLEAQP